MGIAQPCSETCRPLMPNMPANMQTLPAVSSPGKHRISVRTRIQCIIAQTICYTTGKITTFPYAPLQHAPTRPKSASGYSYPGWSNGENLSKPNCLDLDVMSDGDRNIRVNCLQMEYADIFPVWEWEPKRMHRRIHDESTLPAAMGVTMNAIQLFDEWTGFQSGVIILAEPCGCTGHSRFRGTCVRREIRW